MSLKLFTLISSGIALAGGVTTAVVMKNRNSSATEDQDLSLGAAGSQISQSETHTQGSGARNSGGSLDSQESKTPEVTVSNPESLESGSNERERQPEPSAS